MLRVRPSILAAAVYGRGGELFAIYRKPDARADVPERPETDGVADRRRRASLFSSR